MTDLVAGLGGTTRQRLRWLPLGLFKLSSQQHARVSRLASKAYARMQHSAHHTLRSSVLHAL